MINPANTPENEEEEEDDEEEEEEGDEDEDDEEGDEEESVAAPAVAAPPAALTAPSPAAAAAPPAAVAAASPAAVTAPSPAAVTAPPVQAQTVPEPEDAEIGDESEAKEFDEVSSVNPDESTREDDGDTEEKGDEEDGDAEESTQVTETEQSKTDAGLKGGSRVESSLMRTPVTGLFECAIFNEQEQLDVTEESLSSFIFGPLAGAMEDLISPRLAVSEDAEECAIQACTRLLGGSSKEKYGKKQPEPESSFSRDDMGSSEITSNDRRGESEVTPTSNDQSGTRNDQSSLEDDGLDHKHVPDNEPSDGFPKEGRKPQANTTAIRAEADDRSAEEVAAAQADLKEQREHDAILESALSSGRKGDTEIEEEEEEEEAEVTKKVATQPVKIVQPEAEDVGDKSVNEPSKIPDKTEVSAMQFELNKELSLFPESVVQSKPSDAEKERSLAAKIAQVAESKSSTAAPEKTVSMTAGFGGKLPAFLESASLESSVASAPPPNASSELQSDSQANAAPKEAEADAAAAAAAKVASPAKVDEESKGGDDSTHAPETVSGTEEKSKAEEKPDSDDGSDDDDDGVESDEVSVNLDKEALEETADQKEQREKRAAENHKSREQRMAELVVTHEEILDEVKRLKDEEKKNPQNTEEWRDRAVWEREENLQPKDFVYQCTECRSVILPQEVILNAIHFIIEYFSYASAPLIASTPNLFERPIAETDKIKELAERLQQGEFVDLPSSQYSPMTIGFVLVLFMRKLGGILSPK